MPESSGTSDTVIRATVAEVEFGDATAVHEIDARLPGLPGQLILETPAVDLIAGHGQEVTRAAFEPTRDVAVAVVAHEEAKPELSKLLVQQIREPENVAKIVAAGLHRRLAHLVGRLG